MTAAILPPSATPIERALEQVGAEVLGVPVGFDTLWNPDACPASHLHILAATFGVEVWDSAWPEETKRAVIKATPEVKRHKGTRLALDVAINALGMGLNIEEWFEYQGDPYRFRLTITLDEQPFLLQQSQVIYRTAIAAKNVRSYLEAIRVERGISGKVYVGAATRSRLKLRHSYDPLTAINVRGIPSVGAGYYTRQTMRLQ